MIPAPAAVTPAPVPSSPATPAEKAPSAEPSTPVSPQASPTEPAGKEQQTPDPLKTAEPEQPTDAELRRKARNQERWQRMKDAERERDSLRAELALMRNRQPVDYSTMTDPDEIIAEKTAAKLAERDAAVRERNLQAADERVRSEINRAWEGIKSDMRSRVPDFDQVVNSQTPIHERAAPFIAESEKGGEIAYWLGKNPEAARDLFDKFQSAPAQALIELGRIEARLSAPPPKTATKAPQPPPVLTGGANPLAFDVRTAGVPDVQDALRKAGVIR